MGSDKPHKTTTFLVVRDGVKPDWVAIWDTLEITVGRHESQDIAVRGDPLLHQEQFDVVPR